MKRISWEKCLVVILFLMVSGMVGSLFWPYVLNNWLSGFGPAITGWHGFLLGCVPIIGQTSVSLAAITWFVQWIV